MVIAISPSIEIPVLYARMNPSELFPISPYIATGRSHTTAHSTGRSSTTTQPLDYEGAAIPR
jgi:hypothetical protein